VQAKIRLVIHHPFDRVVTRAPLTPQRKDELFRASIEVIEYSYALKSEPRIDSWLWFFQHYVQWHALAYVLAELGYRSGSDAVDRAWRILDLALGDWDSVYDRNKESPLWRPMNRLMIQARHVRETDLKTRSSKSSPIRPSFYGSSSVENASNPLGDLDFSSAPTTAAIWGQDMMQMSPDLALPMDFAKSLGGFSQNIGSAAATVPYCIDPGVGAPTAPALGPRSAPGSFPGIVGGMGDLPDLSSGGESVDDIQNVNEYFAGLSSEAWADLARNFHMDLETRV
jgi:hypothetical protein